MTVENHCWSVGEKPYWKYYMFDEDAEEEEDDEVSGTTSTAATSSGGGSNWNIEVDDELPSDGYISV